MDDLLTHVGKDHVKCDLCDYVCHDKNDLNNHKQTNHKSVKVVIGEKDLVEIQCDQCDFQCRLNIILKKHNILTILNKFNGFWPVMSII